MNDYLIQTLDLTFSGCPQIRVGPIHNHGVYPQVQSYQIFFIHGYVCNCGVENVSVMVPKVRFEMLFGRVWVVVCNCEYSNRSCSAPI